MKAPPRIVEDASISAELRASLREEAATQSGYDVEAGLEKLRAALAPGGELEPQAMPDAPSESLAASATATTISAGAKLSVLVAAVAVAGLAAVWMRAGSDPAPLPEPPPAPGALDRAAGGATPGGAASTDHAAPSAARARREVDQLVAINRLLERDPEAAYSMAEAGHLEFGEGMLYPEREALAVLALWESGRQDEALRRGRAFVERFPDSPLRAQLERRLRGLAPPPR